MRLQRIVGGGGGDGGGGVCSLLSYQTLIIRNLHHSSPIRWDTECLSWVLSWLRDVDFVLSFSEITSPMSLPSINVAHIKTEITIPEYTMRSILIHLCDRTMNLYNILWHAWYHGCIPQSIARRLDCAIDCKRPLKNWYKYQPVRWVTNAF